MISKRCLFSMVIIFVVNISSASSYSAPPDNEVTRRTLKGLEGIYVLIGNLRPVLMERGLTRDQIRTDVELKLRMAGIRVLSEDERFEIPGSPHLAVSVNAVKSKSGNFAFDIHIGLGQEIILNRNPAIISLGETWSTGTVGLLGENRIMNIREYIKGCADEFINAYLSVNPKK